jgi:hypothetical protein
VTKEQFADELVRLFPEKQTRLHEHCQAYNEILGHVFFADEINIPLVALLEKGEDTSAIEKYCAFIEDMWFHGDSDTRNVVEVTIIERLTDDPLVWLRFGQYISKKFRWKINEDILPLLGLNVPRLPTDVKPQKRRKGKNVIGTRKNRKGATSAMLI